MKIEIRITEDLKKAFKEYCLTNNFVMTEVLINHIKSLCHDVKNDILMTDKKQVPKKVEPVMTEPKIVATNNTNVMTDQKLTEPKKDKPKEFKKVNGSWQWI